MKTASNELISQLKEQSPIPTESFGLQVSSDVTLAPVGSWVLEEEELIQDLVNWRSENKRSFFAQVPATSSSMRSYLATYAIGDPNRILFIIRHEGTWSGHIGLANISKTSAELDNVLRGRKTYPGMMLEVVEFVKSWASDILGVPKIYLRVKADNEAAISLYSRSGFKKIDENAPQVFGNIDLLHLEAVGGLVMSVDINRLGKLGRRSC